MTDNNQKSKTSTRSWSPHMQKISLSSRFSQRQLRRLKEAKAFSSNVHQWPMNASSDSLDHSINDLSPSEKKDVQQAWQSSVENRNREKTDHLSILGSFLIHLMLKIIDIMLIFAAGIFVWKALDVTLFAARYRSFYCKDLSGISYPFQENTVSAESVAIASMIVPLVVIEVSEWFFVSAGLPHLSSIEAIAVQMANSTNVMLKYLCAFTLHAIFVQLIKCWVGRLRPNFIAMCQPDWNAIGIDCTIDENANQIVTETHCQGGPKWETQGRNSFPSGHSSCIAFLAAFVVLYTQEISMMYKAANVNHHNNVQRRRTRKVVRYLRRIIQPLIIIYAILVCCSRIFDHWHYPTDVLAGAVIGLTGAYLTFGMNTLQHAIDSRNFDI